MHIQSPYGVCAGTTGRENSQTQCSCRGQPFCGLNCWQLQEITYKIVKEYSDGLRRGMHHHAVHLVRVCCAHTVLVTVYPNVIEVDNGRPLHVGAKQHHANDEALISEFPALHLRNLTVEAQTQFVAMIARSFLHVPPLRKV